MSVIIDEVFCRDYWRNIYVGFKLKQHSLNYNLILPFILGFEVWKNATLFLGKVF